MGLKAHKAILQNIHLPVWVITSHYSTIPTFQYSGDPASQTSPLRGASKPATVGSDSYYIFSKKAISYREWKFIDMLKRKRASLNALFHR